MLNSKINMTTNIKGSENVSEKEPHFGEFIEFMQHGYFVKVNQWVMKYRKMTNLKEFIEYFRYLQYEKNNKFSNRSFIRDNQKSAL